MKAWLSNPVQKKISWSSQLIFSNVKTTQSLLNLSNVSNSKTVFDELITQAGKLFKNGKSTTVVPVKIGTTEYVLKRFNARDIIHVFSRALRKTRAKRCWQRNYDFAQAGINVAEPILMYEHRVGPFRLDAYFVCEKLQGQELLTVLPNMSESEQQAVLIQMKQVFEKMRSAKLTHGDMKASNLMWVDGELFFIDLDASRKHVLNKTWQYSHKKDRKRFMKNWRDNPSLLALFNDL